MKKIKSRKANIRKILVFTGTRADYGLLKPLMHELKIKENIILQVIASGTHLLRNYGSTYKEIIKDGFNISYKIDIGIKGDSKVDVANSMGKGIKLYAKCLNILKPDIVVVLGDRYEALAFAQASMIMNVPIAHIHGGESTEGLIDEPIRHSITKMSHLHFATAEKYRSRIIQMGESPKKVFNYGAPGLDNIALLKLFNKKEIEKKLRCELSNNVILLCYHPVTLEDANPINTLEKIFKAIEKIPNTSVIASKSNSDAFGMIINKFLVQKLEEKKLILKASFGQQLFLSLIKVSDVMIGNSSSGIIEAPSLGTPTINIGNRQKGRLKAKSIINCSENYKDIDVCLKKIFSKNNISIKNNIKNPYGFPGASKKIAKKLAHAPLENILFKSFREANI